jgi:hypothetical protein
MADDVERNTRARRRSRRPTDDVTWYLPTTILDFSHYRRCRLLLIKHAFHVKRIQDKLHRTRHAVHAAGSTAFG